MCGGRKPPDQPPWSHDPLAESGNPSFEQLPAMGLELTAGAPTLCPAMLAAGDVEVNKPSFALRS